MTQSVYRSLLRPFCQLLVALVLLSASALSAAATVELTQHWQYRWGDSPRDAAGAPLWAQEVAPDAWKAIDFPSNPPGRDGRENVWYRTLLPEGEWRDPVLYIFSVDLIVEVYVDGQRIYHYGQFDAEGKGEFAGWPWHMITLPAHSAGKEIYFRVFSNYYDIGLWGEVKVMERLDLLDDLIGQSLNGLVTGGFSLLLALLSMLFALLRTERRIFLALTLYALASAGLTLSASPANLLLWYNPLAWEFIGANAYFLTPLAMALLLERWFHSTTSRLYNLIWKLSLLFLLIANLLSLSKLVALSDIYPLFDLFFAASLLLMLIPAVGLLKTASRAQKLILFAYALLSGMLILDMAIAHGLLPWGQVPLPWASLAFSLAIVALALHHYSHTQRQLAELNLSLETQVQERTTELKQLVERESARAAALALENRMSNQLGEVIAALQNCDDLDQGRAVLSAQLPTLFESLPGALYLLNNVGYELDTCWGYSANHTPPQTIAARPASRPGTVTDASSQPWYFSLNFQRNRQASVHLGLLLLTPGDKLDNTGYPLEQLHTFICRGIDQLSLTLSILSLHDELTRFSYEDALTGLKNRRFLNEAIAREISLAERLNLPLSAMICDIDHFKRFNDSYGHAAGDSALRHLADQLSRAFRHTDIICRYGGEEFVVLMPNASAEDCQIRAEQLRQEISRQPVYFNGKALEPITLSAGIASWPCLTDDPQQLLIQADQALYEAKQTGRDRIVARLQR